MPNSTPSTGGPRQASDQPVDRVVEEAEQVACLVRAADRKRQSNHFRVDALRDEFHTAGVFVASVDYRAHAFRRPFCDELRQILTARRNAGLGLDGASLAQPEPVFEITPTFVIGADR